VKVELAPGHLLLLDEVLLVLFSGQRSVVLLLTFLGVRELRNRLGCRRLLLGMMVICSGSCLSGLPTSALGS
jgi:hypothetical protein